MSLIEAAIRKAKELAIAERGVTAPVPETKRSRHPPRHRVPPAPVTEAARRFHVAGVDAITMERQGLLLQVHDPAAERSYKILRTRLQQQLEVSDGHAIAITSAGAGEGKTLTAINLAIVLARDVNSWVFLVDLDLQRPQMATYLGMSFDKGLSDYLGGQASFDDIVYEIGVDRLAVIPNARPLEQSSELLGSPRMQELCRSLATEVPRRIVIFDMPPLLLSDDVIKFMPNVDGLLFVVAEGRTQRATLQQAREIMPEEKLIGIMLNRSAEREKSGYY